MMQWWCNFSQVVCTYLQTHVPISERIKLRKYSEFQIFGSYESSIRWEFGGKRDASHRYGSSFMINMLKFRVATPRYINDRSDFPALFTSCPLTKNTHNAAVCNTYKTIFQSSPSKNDSTSNARHQSFTNSLKEGSLSLSQTQPHTLFR